MSLPIRQNARHRPRPGAVALLLGLGTGLGALAPGAVADEALAGQRLQFQVTAAAIANGQSFSREQLRRSFGDYVLVPYLEHRQLRRDLARLEPGPAREFLAREGDTHLGRQFRREYLGELARRGDWRGFLAADDPAVARTTELRCHRLTARLQGGAPGPGEAAELRTELQALWATAQSLPTACDGPIARGRQAGWIDSEQIWSRLRLAANAGNGGLATFLVRQLPEKDRAAAERLALAARDPAAALKAAAGWSDGPVTREAVALALRRQARAKVDLAIGHWQQLGGRFDFAAADRTAILHDLALYSAAAFRPDAGEWFRQIPREARSEALAEWQLRAALAGRDWPGVLAATGDLPGALSEAPRARYWQARSLDQLGRRAEARELFGAVATEANFHGFLAADRVEAPYSLCPLEVPVAPDRAAAVARIPDVARALELHAIGWRTEAGRAFEEARTRLSDEDRHQLLRLASEAGWHDRVVFGLSSGEDLRQYALRFPLAKRETVEKEAAANDLDPALAFALIRAESAWQPDARSAANAYGLMQILPGTGQGVARELGVPWQGTATLLDPATNIRLGTRYLANQARRFEGSPWLATAAYNAGPAPVQRWLDQRRDLPADAFIETIPYRETREYVARVLAFSVIYDWRLRGEARPITSRLPDPGRPWPGPTDATKPVVCAQA